MQAEEQGATNANAAASSSKKRPRKRSRKSRTQVGVSGGGGEEDGQGSEPGDVRPAEVAAPTNGGKDVAESAAVEVKANAPAPAPKQPQVQPQTKSTTSSNPAPSILTSNPHKPSVLPRPSLHGSRKYTLSVALPSSILYNVPTPELKTRLVGSIARICAVFNVDEIVVFDDGTEQPAPGQWRRDRESGGAPTMGRKREWNDENDEGGATGHHEGKGDDAAAAAPAFDASSFMAMILQYLETPQYLRKQLFPMHPNLRLAGLLPPLDCPHHLRFEEESPYREGIVVDEPHWAARAGQGQDGATVWVNVGSRDPVQCGVVGDAWPDVGTRVTVEMPTRVGSQGSLVSPRTPIQQRGLYWGYTVRVCPSLSSVFSTPEEYDLVMGTSERGDSLTDVLHATQTGETQLPSSKPTSVNRTITGLPSGFSRALVLFGGLSGLEVAIEKDRDIPLGRADAHELCDFWIDCVEGQGSRTVRTEEAITITLARLKTALEQAGRR